MFKNKKLLILAPVLLLSLILIIYAYSFYPLFYPLLISLLRPSGLTEYSIKPPYYEGQKVGEKFATIGQYYYLDENSVYGVISYDNGYMLKKIIEADRGTFEVLKDGYFAKDKNNVYYQGQTLKGADPDTFKIVSLLYAKDVKKVYCQGKEFIGIDPLTFQIIGTRDWHVAKDINNVVFRCEKISSADSASFVFVESFYFKDKNNIYFVASDRASIIEGADPFSFSTYKSNADYSRDKNFVYLDNKKINGADPNTFTILEPSVHFYSKDNKRVFYYENTVNGADPDTFIVVDLPGGCQPRSSVCWENTYGRDKNYVYRNGEKIEGLQPNNLEQYNNELKKSGSSLY